MSLSTQQIAVSGLLCALTLVLGLTGLGFVPVPTPAGNATFMHIIVIAGAVVGGPVVGGITGFMFGLFSWLRAEIPLFADPLIAIPPRILIGIVAYLVYAVLRRMNFRVALAVAAVAGSLTNTVLVVGSGYLRRLIPLEAIPAIVPQAIFEAVLAAVLVTAIGIAAQQGDLLMDQTSRGTSRAVR